MHTIYQAAARRAARAARALTLLLPGSVLLALAVALAYLEGQVPR